MHLLSEWLSMSSNISYLSIIIDSNGCDKISPEAGPKHMYNGTSCFVFRSKNSHDQYDGRCVEFNEVLVNALMH